MAMCCKSNIRLFDFCCFSSASFVVLTRLFKLLSFFHLLVEVMRGLRWRQNYIHGVSEKSGQATFFLKTFWNIFSSVKSFCVKFCEFVDRKTLMLKKQTVYNYRILRQAMTTMTSFLKSWYAAYFMGEYIKLDRVKTMGTRGKIKVI